MNTYKHIAVVGRLHGDDEDSCLMYQDMTAKDARWAFICEMRRDAGISERDVVQEYESANVYINYVLGSHTPIEHI